MNLILNSGPLPLALLGSLTVARCHAQEIHESCGVAEGAEDEDVLVVGIGGDASELVHGYVANANGVDLHTSVPQGCGPTAEDISVPIGPAIWGGRKRVNPL